jgi:hypothetical protein
VLPIRHVDTNERDNAFAEARFGTPKHGPDFLIKGSLFADLNST